MRVGMKSNISKLKTSLRSIFREDEEQEKIDHIASQLLFIVLGVKESAFNTELLMEFAQIMDIECSMGDEVMEFIMDIDNKDWSFYVKKNSLLVVPGDSKIKSFFICLIENASLPVSEIGKEEIFFKLVERDGEEYRRRRMGDKKDVGGKSRAA